jgi:hypothetical protein
MRKKGLLRSFKAGGVGRNLTSEEHVEELEVAKTAEAGA